MATHLATTSAGRNAMSLVLLGWPHAVFGIAPDDDDGEAASKSAQSSPKPAQRPQTQRNGTPPAPEPPEHTDPAIDPDSTKTEPEQAKPASNGNGNGDGWNPAWTTAKALPFAFDWAKGTGKFSHEKHLQAAWTNYMKQYQPMKSEDHAGTFLAAWHKYVLEHHDEGQKVAA